MSTKWTARPRGARRTRSDRPYRLAFCCSGALVLALVWAMPGYAQGDAKGPEATLTAPTKYRMPAVPPAQFTAFAGDSVRAWARSTAPKANDRPALYAAVRELLRMNARFGERVAKIYPKNQLEWLTITDRAADSLVVRLGPILQAFGKAYPEELLGAGRIAYEERMAQIVGPPSRMLGFHVTLLAGYAVQQADSLLAGGGVADAAGVQDGVLRNLQDWYHLYDEAHLDVIERHMSHMNAEDWTLVRMEDNCGNKGNDVWERTDMYVAIIGRDSTRTPPQDLYAHEYTMVSRKCPEDKRVIYLEMPLYVDAQLEYYRRSQVEEGATPEEPKKPPR